MRERRMLRKLSLLLQTQPNHSRASSWTGILETCKSTKCTTPSYKDRINATNKSTKMLCPLSPISILTIFLPFNQLQRTISTILSSSWGATWIQVKVRNPTSPSTKSSSMKRCIRFWLTNKSQRLQSFSLQVRSKTPWVQTRRTCWNGLSSRGNSKSHWHIASIHTTLSTSSKLASIPSNGLCCLRRLNHPWPCILMTRSKNRWVPAPDTPRRGNYKPAN